MKIYLDNCCFNRPFDYTKWRSVLLEEFDNMSVEELSALAMKEYNETQTDNDIK
ncbi:MAG: hypothetical protein LBS74_01500 [Oscillospiraceae bacterium]|nr:hypothetical protein [Oscillospiraceae bacterium]